MLKDKIEKLFEQFPMSHPGMMNEPEGDDIDRNESGWERHPSEDNWGDEDEFDDGFADTRPGEIPQEIIDHAKEALEDMSLIKKLGSMTVYRELVEIILDVPQFRKWFENSYNGNEFDLRQELEEILGGTGE